MKRVGTFFKNYWNYILIGVAVFLIGGMLFVISVEYGWFDSQPDPVEDEVTGEVVEEEGEAETPAVSSPAPVRQSPNPSPSAPTSPPPDDEVPWLSGPSDPAPPTSGGSGSGLPWYDGPSD